ncbi:MAG: hypothetical protein PHE38_05100 [Alishewanella agri]|nr:hypothetical protein [Alishewanella agri]
MAACEENLTIGCTATGFPPLRSSKPAREPGVIAYEVVSMLGPKLKHKIFSTVLFFIAALLFVSVVRKIDEHGAVSFETASGFGSVLFVLSIALIPEFAFLKLTEAFKVRKQSGREKISERLVLIGMVLVVIGFIGNVAL